MNALRKKWPVFLLAWSAFLSLAQAAPPILKVGDPAPKLHTGKWLQGGPIRELQPGKAYLIEFWATWCGPCRPAIPRLNELQAKFKDKGLNVIALASFEQDDALVEPFIKTMGDMMTYRVALDDKTVNTNGMTAANWMGAARRREIPSAFLVGKAGVLAWIGHPLQLTDEMVEQVLSGNYDLKIAAADYEKNLQLERAQDTQIAPAQARMKAMYDAMRTKKWDEALRELAAVEKLMPEPGRVAAVELPLQVARFVILLGRKDYPAVYKAAADLSDAHKNNAELQNYLAWEIISDRDIEKPNFPLAEMLINRANQASAGRNYEILDTQARLFFMEGKKDRAIQTETQAVALAGSDHKPAMESALDSYKKGELPAVHSRN